MLLGLIWIVTILSLGITLVLIAFIRWLPADPSAALIGLLANATGYLGGVVTGAISTFAVLKFTDRQGSNGEPDADQ
jgi:hypothetical protein